jgi:ACS family glucarate transporter-like MFS transporter
MVNYGWQSAFYVCGVLGIVIALWWAAYARDRPEQHRRVNQAELQYIRSAPLPPTLSHRFPRPGAPVALQNATGRRGEGEGEGVPWVAFLRTPSVWWLVLSYTGLGYVAYVYMSWFYLYLVNERGFDILRGAFLAMGPFLAIAVFCPLGGWITDALVSRLGVNAGRWSIGLTGMCLSGLCIIAGTQVAHPYTGVGLLSLGAGFLYFAVGAFWASTIDLTPRHAGTLSGIMNTGANIGGTISPTLTPWLAEQFGWNLSLACAAGVAMLGGLLWLLVRPGDGLRM